MYMGQMGSPYELEKQKVQWLETYMVKYNRLINIHVYVEGRNVHVFVTEKQLHYI